MDNYNEPMLPPPPVATSEGMWVKLYRSLDHDGYTEVTDRSGATIEDFDSYADALEFVRFNRFRLKTVHTTEGERMSFLHLVGE